MTEYKPCRQVRAGGAAGDGVRVPPHGCGGDHGARRVPGDRDPAPHRGQGQVSAGRWLAEAVSWCWLLIGQGLRVRPRGDHGEAGGRAAAAGRALQAGAGDQAEAQRVHGGDQLCPQGSQRIKKK